MIWEFFGGPLPIVWRRRQTQHSYCNLYSLLYPPLGCYHDLHCHQDNVQHGAESCSCTRAGALSASAWLAPFPLGTALLMSVVSTVQSCLHFFPP